MNITAQLWRDRQDAERDARLARIKRAVDYYEGRHTPQLDTEDGDYNDNVIVNLARPIVDRGVAFLFGKELTWQIDETVTGDTKLETFLKRVWKANKKMVLLQEVAQNGALSGMAFVKIDPQPDSTYRLINLDPATVTVSHSPQDIEDVWRYRIEYTAADENGREVHYRQDTERLDPKNRQSHWVIRSYEASGAGARYVKVGDDVAWKYPWPPIAHCKNLPAANQVWGYADLDDTALHDALNLIASAMRRTLRLHAHPQTIIFGAAADGLERGPANMWAFPDAPDARAENLEMQSDLAAAKEFYLTLRNAIYTTARMPDMAAIQDKLGNMTNFGLRVLFADLLQKNELKRLLYGDLVETLCKRLAELGGFGTDIDLALTWQDPLPVNTLEKANEVTVKQKTGLASDETLTGELGYTYQDEQIRRTAEGHPKAPAASSNADAHPVSVNGQPPVDHAGQAPA
jgi:hypothetical protein